MNKLPELPEGYYFEVFERGSSRGYDRAKYAVSIRRKRKWWFAVVEETETFSYYPSSSRYVGLFAAQLSDENVLHYATECYKRWQSKNARNLTEERLLGKYPPKKLEL